MTLLIQVVSHHTLLSLRRCQLNQNFLLGILGGEVMVLQHIFSHHGFLPLLAHLHCLFGGGNYTSSSTLKTLLRNLHCGAHVADYVTQWHAGVTQLNNSGYPFTLRESLEAFVDHLPDMDHKLTKDLVYRSFNRPDLDLPSFELILERVITTDTHIYHT